MPCFRGFGVFRGSLIFGDKSEYMVAAPAFRVGRRATEGEPRVRLFGFSPEGDTSLPLVRKPPDPDDNTTNLHFFDAPATISDTAHFTYYLV
jgi:hypothetical protein